MSRQPRVAALATAVVALLALGTVALGIWAAGSRTGHLGAGVDSPAPPQEPPLPPPPVEQTDLAEGAEPAPVRLELGAELQEVVDRHPPGTEFVVAAGVHRLQSVVPRDGDRFVGEPGAVLSGARVIDPSQWRYDGAGRWVLAGQTQSGPAYPGDPLDRMLPGHVAEERPEELFSDGQRLRKVDEPWELGPGTWYFDYAAARMVLNDDPATLGRLETSVTAHAFSGRAAGVHIENLTVRHYANPSQRGAIDGDEGVDWTVRDVTAHDNHAVGIRVGRGGVVVGCRMVGNGQMGLIAHGKGTPGELGRPVRVESNEITGNKALGYDPAWEGGGTKMIRTVGGVFRNNWVHGNAGYGFWFDIDNVDARIESNLVEGNELVGIFYEISKDALIRWNVSRDNGRRKDVQGELRADNSALLISSSSGVEVTGNALSGSGGFALLASNHSDRFGDETSQLGSNEIDDLLVHGNDLAVAGGAVGVQSDVPHTFTDRRINFRGNRYRVDQRSRFHWAGDALTRADVWLERVGERGAEVLSDGGPPELPADAVPFRRERYGAGPSPSAWP